MLFTWQGKRIKANGFRSIHSVKAQFRKAGCIPGEVASLIEEDGAFHWICSCGAKLRFTKTGKTFNNLCIIGGCR